MESRQLGEVFEKSPSEIYEDLKNGLLEIKESAPTLTVEKRNSDGETQNEEEKVSEDVNFDEMYSKVFND